VKSSPQQAFSSMLIIPRMDAGDTTNDFNHHNKRRDEW